MEEHMTDPSKALFDNYERHYEDSRPGDRTLDEIKELHFDRLPRWLNCIEKPAKILDAGCARGYLLSLLYKAGYHNLAGVDISSQLAAQARKFLPDNVEITVSDILSYLTNLPNNSFDVILFHHVLEHIPRERNVQLIKEFRRCLKPNGYLNIKTPNTACLTAGYDCFGDFTHVVFFNEQSLMQVIEASGFNVKDAEFIRHPPILFWSHRHAGRSILRILNYFRWHLNNILHRVIFMIGDAHPKYCIFERELEILVQKK